MAVILIEVFKIVMFFHPSIIMQSCNSSSIVTVN